MIGLWIWRHSNAFTKDKSSRYEAYLLSGPHAMGKEKMWLKSPF